VRWRSRGETSDSIRGIRPDGSPVISSIERKSSASMVFGSTSPNNGSRRFQDARIEQKKRQRDREVKTTNIGAQVGSGKLY
jgi:hypothetical protein